jgi:hypothetical protein
LRGQVLLLLGSRSSAALIYVPLVIVVVTKCLSFTSTMQFSYVGDAAMGRTMTPTQGRQDYPIAYRSHFPPMLKPQCRLESSVAVIHSSRGLILSTLGRYIGARFDLDDLHAIHKLMGKQVGDTIEERLLVHDLWMPHQVIWCA